MSNQNIFTVGDIPKDILSDAKHTIPKSINGAVSAANELILSIPGNIPWDQAMKLFQTQFILHKIKTHKGPVNQRSLAAELGWSKGTTHRRLNELNIDLREHSHAN